jgi:hypothetical protein
LDNPNAPEAFATEASGFFFFAGNVHITFCTPRSDYGTNPGTINRVVNARLVMPADGAVAMITGLTEFLKSQGVNVNPDPQTPPAAPVDKRKLN